MVLASEPVLASLYRDAQSHVLGWRMFAAMLASEGVEQRFTLLEPLLTTFDERVVSTYAETLGLAAPRRPKAIAEVHTVNLPAAKSRERGRCPAKRAEHGR
jgi:hypothetical protein